VLNSLSTTPRRGMGEWIYRYTRFLVLGNSWRGVVSFTSQPFTPPPPRKESPVLTGKEAGWAPESVCRTWRRENSWPYLDSNSQSLCRLRYPSFSLVIRSALKYGICVHQISVIVRITAFWAATLYNIILVYPECGRNKCLRNISNELRDGTLSHRRH
jgi:hypothetical protein